MHFNSGSRKNRIYYKLENVIEMLKRHPNYFMVSPLGTTCKIPGLLKHNDRVFWTDPLIEHQCKEFMKNGGQLDIVGCRANLPILNVKNKETLDVVESQVNSVVKAEEVIEDIIIADQTSFNECLSQLTHTQQSVLLIIWQFIKEYITQLAKGLTCY